MASLTYVGKTPAAATDLTNLGYDEGIATASLTQTQVDTLLNTAFAPYVTKSYVDTQDGFNATKSYIDTGDATRLHLSQIGVNSGIAGLLATGKVEVARVNVSSTQRFPAGYYSPAAYNTGNITNASTTVPTQVYTFSVADPGFVYKLLITGMVDASTSVDGQYPIITIHQGATTGQVLAAGTGLQETYSATGTPTGPITIVPTYLNLQTAITGATTLYVMLIRSGTTGTMTATAVRPALTAVAIPS